MPKLKYGIHVSIADFKPNPEMKTLYMGSSLMRAFQIVKAEHGNLKPGVAMHMTLVRLTDGMISARETGDSSGLPDWMVNPGERT